MDIFYQHVEQGKESTMKGRKTDNGQGREVGGEVMKVEDDTTGEKGDEG